MIGAHFAFSSFCNHNKKGLKMRLNTLFSKVIRGFAVRIALAIMVFSMQSYVWATDNDTALTIEDIVCTGNASTDCEFIRDHVFLSAGDLLNEDELQNAKIRLGVVPNFSTSEIRLKKGSERGKVIVEIEVHERSPLATETSFGTAFQNSSLSQRLAGKVSHQNLFGKGKRADFLVDSKIPIGSSEHRLQAFHSRLQYLDPHLFDSKKYFLSTGIGYTAENSIWPSVSYSRHELEADVFLTLIFWLVAMADAARTETLSAFRHQDDLVGRWPTVFKAGS